MAAIIAAAGARAQSLDLTVDDYGLSIGDSRRVNGIRLNYRDRNMRQVNGLNATLWDAYVPAQGIVNGIAIGLPLTGARRLAGVGVGVFGVSAEESAHGITIGGLGAGAGQDLVGITIGGLGGGSGRDIKGFMIGGLGAGAGNDLSGIAIGGVGVGAGGTIRGIGIAGVGAGAPAIRGLVVSGLAAGGNDVVGVLVAPGYVQIGESGRMKGMSVSAFNHIKGRQQGIAIGLLNIAGRLDGIQLGVLNVARNNPRGLRILPILNAHFD